MADNFNIGDQPATTGGGSGGAVDANITNSPLQVSQNSGDIFTIQDVNGQAATGIPLDTNVINTVQVQPYGGNYFYVQQSSGYSFDVTASTPLDVNVVGGGSAGGALGSTPSFYNRSIDPLTSDFVVPQNLNRTYLLIINPDTNGDDFYISDGSITPTEGVKLQPGQQLVVPTTGQVIAYHTGAAAQSVQAIEVSA